ncbi:MarR family winged helix-turn-helix transcriptional regulator [Luteimicrobium subarcticum]|uniref:DNA-binding MarR family transcriptional regulator n=1 Tax=Luteimicrobium subarcticum TaxID=620910 RepID=A0A2M8WTD8_9MICO|nr:MarR family transcriptional regulator [Luteimicrobium subarcticum]PJI94144.1 DNA-binding MarR family transcriptional regulator [Luteimicrobium subarcticum]
MTSGTTPSPTGAALDRSRDALSRIEFEVAQLLRRADRSVARGMRGAVAGGTGMLDRSAYLLLHVLAVEGAQNVNAAAERLGLDASTVTRQVDSLEKAGHVKRRRDPQDGRAVLVEATDSGLAALEHNRTERKDLYAEVLASWSQLDRSLLAELLHRLNADLDTFRRRD